MRTLQTVTYVGTPKIVSQQEFNSSCGRWCCISNHTLCYIPGGTDSIFWNIQYIQPHAATLKLILLGVCSQDNTPGLLFISLYKINQLTNLFLFAFFYNTAFVIIH